MPPTLNPLIRASGAHMPCTEAFAAFIVALLCSWCFMESFPAEVLLVQRQWAKGAIEPGDVHWLFNLRTSVCSKSLATRCALSSERDTGS